MDGGDSANAFIQDGIPYVGSKVTSFQNFNQHTIHIFIHVFFTHPPTMLIFSITWSTLTRKQKINKYFASYIDR